MKLLPSTAGTHRDRDLGSRVVNISVLRSWLLLTGINVWAPGWLTNICACGHGCFSGMRGKAEHELLLNFSLLHLFSQRESEAV